MKKPIRWMGAALVAALAAPALALQVARLDAAERIVVDGRLDEAAWARAEAHDRFWQLFPDAEVPAPVRTEMRVAYDGHALYVAFRAFDPEPAKLREPFARRDNVLADQDMIALFVDPVGQRKVAQFFRVNPRGSVGDGLYNEDSSTEDFSPDFDFEVATARFDGGWTAELRIPLASLRYTEAGAANWTIMAYRVWPREQRYRMSTSRLPREQTCFLCLNEPLTGITDLPAPRHLTLTPNVTVRELRTRGGGEPRRRELDVVPSLDVKWRPRADTVIDATLNPDFSQVELDTPQLSGNAPFALFFPEKRPFFLEGADMYESSFRAIYTRSITDPAWGLRGTQRNEALDGTVLVARDEGGGSVLLPGPYRTGFARQDFKSTATIARVRAQSPGLTLGGLFTDRTIEGGAYNRVAGPDVVWFPRAEHRVRAQLLGSWTTAQPRDGTLVKGESASGHAAGLEWVYHGPAWDQVVDYKEISPRFRADDGFVEQAGVRSLYAETFRKVLNVGAFNEVTPYAISQYKASWDGSLNYAQVHPGVRLGLPRATIVAFEVRSGDRVVTREGGRTLRRDQLYASFESNPWPWAPKAFVEAAFGDRVDVANDRVARGVYAGGQLNLRPHERAELEYRVEHATLDHREAVEGSRRILTETSQQLLGLWHFTARDSLRAIWQASSAKRAPSLWLRPVSSHDAANVVSVVYGHRRGLGTSFYVGATFGRQRDPDGFVKAYQAEVFVKGSWALDVRP